MITKKSLKAKNKELQNIINDYVVLIEQLENENKSLSDHSGTIEVFQDTANEWRWHYKSTNGKIMFPSAQGFSKSNCMRAAKKVQQILGGEDITPIVTIDS